jgi:hypothetical protein
MMTLANTGGHTAQARSGALGQMTPSKHHTMLQSKLPVPVVLYLLTVVLPIGFDVGPLALTSLRMLLLIMVLPLLGKLFAGHYGRVFLTDILFLAHILWATVALAANNPTLVVQQIGSVGVEFIGGYLIGRAYIRTQEDFFALCRWLIFLVLCTAPFAVFEAKTGRPLVIEFLRKLPGLTSVSIVYIEARMGMERVQAVFAHPIHYGLFCSVAFSLAFVALRDITTNGWRYLSSVIVAGCGFLALSSGALMAIVLQISLILWSSIFAKVKWRWWLLVALFGLAYVVVDALSNRDPLRVFMSYATFSAHNAYWRGIIFEWGMKNIWANPIYGIGLNDWVRPWYMYSGSMDNFWLVMGVRYGIPGFVLLAAGYAWAIFLVMRRNFEASALLTQIRRAWVFTFLGLSFTLTTVHVWTNIYSFVFFMFGAGMWLIKAEPTPTADPETNLAPQSTVAGRGLVYSRFAPKVTRKTTPGEPSE